MIIIYVYKDPINLWHIAHMVMLNSIIISSINQDLLQLVLIIYVIEPDYYLSITAFFDSALYKHAVCFQLTVALMVIWTVGCLAFCRISRWFYNDKFILTSNTFLLSIPNSGHIILPACITSFTDRLGNSLQLGTYGNSL